MNRTSLSLAAGVLVLTALTGCVNREAQEQGRRTAKIVSDPVRLVTLTPATTETLTETLEVTGDVTAGQDTSIAAKAPGRITAIYVRDGDSVTAGQLLATLESTQAQAQLSQAQAQVGTALASMNQALAQQRSARSTVTQAQRAAQEGPSQTRAAVRQAQAQLQSARAQLRKAEEGARPEERRQAEANVRSAEVNLQTQERELRRIETLVREGALAGARLDQQRNATENARAQFRNAQESLNLIRNGTRVEDIDIAKAAVRQAEEGVQNALAAQRLDPSLQDQVSSARAQVELAQAQYASARSQLESAQAQVRIAQEALADTRIVAPFNGRVAGRPEQVGTVAGSQTVIVRIIGGNGVYFSGQLPSSEFERVRAGMPVAVTTDALPNRTFNAKVAAVSPIANAVGRLFSVRIQLPDSREIRPGMFARGRITVRRVPNAVVVPQVAIVRRGDETYVMVGENGQAKRRNVTLGLSQGDLVQVNGLPLGAQVVSAGQESLTEGAKIRTDKETPKASTEPGKAAERA